MIARPAAMTFALAAVATAVTLRAALGWAWPIEACLFAGVFWIFARQPVIRRTWLDLPLPHQIACLALPMALMLGQLADRSPVLFPFVGWSMYSLPASGDPTFVDYTMVLADGTETSARPMLVIPSISVRMKQQYGMMLERAMALDDGPQKQAEIDRFVAQLRTLGRSYNQRHPEAPVRQLLVWQCTVPLDAWKGDDSIRRDLLMIIEIPSLETPTGAIPEPR